MPAKSPAKRGRGRPAHVPTPALRRKVANAAGGGMKHWQIAEALGLSPDTLVKYYQAELSTVAASKRLEVIDAMQRQAVKGSVSAARLYLAQEPELAAPPLIDGDTPVAPQPPTAAPAPAPKPAAVGKKEQAAIDAQTAHIGTEWADLLKTPGAPTAVQ